MCTALTNEKVNRGLKRRMHPETIALIDTTIATSEKGQKVVFVIFGQKQYVSTAAAAATYRR